MTEITFSIIVPIYNVENYLSDCLDSILSQSFRDFEVIGINDASTDNSYHILTDYANKYSNIRVINLIKNQGLSHARNMGMDIAKGKYLVFVDSDDMIATDMLKILWRNIKDEDIDLLYFNMDLLIETNWAKEKVREVEYTEFEGIYSGIQMFVELYKNKQMKVEVCRQVYAKKFIEDNNLRFYEGILHEDNLFSFLCAMKAKKVKNINEKLYIYRQREGSIMSSINEKRMESLMIVISEIYHYWKENSSILKIDDIIESYLLDLISVVKKYRKYFPSHKKLNCGTRADQFLYDLLFSDSQQGYEYIDISEEQVAQIRKYGQIVIFGAGSVGIEVMQFLKENNIDNFIFAVSNKENNPEKIMDVKVYGIEEIKKSWDTALFIISVVNKKQKEISDELQERGICNILIPNMKQNEE